MKAREAEVAKKEKERKQRKEFHERREAALIVLDRLEYKLDGNVNQLCDGDLKMLLRWKGVPISKMGNMATKRVHYKKIVDGGAGGDDEASNPAPWTVNGEYELERLRTAPIDIGDTAYGRFEAQ
jgi:hypothetical protein